MHYFLQVFQLTLKNISNKILTLLPWTQKCFIFHSLGKQMVSDAHPAPWFANTISRRVDADGLVSEGDTPRWLILPVSERISERSGERSGNRKEKQKNTVPDVKLLARVNLVDDRGCVGPAGNATAFGEL